MRGLTPLELRPDFFFFTRDTIEVLRYTVFWRLFFGGGIGGGSFTPPKIVSEFLFLFRNQFSLNAFLATGLFPICGNVALCVFPFPWVGSSSADRPQNKNYL